MMDGCLQGCGILSEEGIKNAFVVLDGPLGNVFHGLGDCRGKQLQNGFTNANHIRVVCCFKDCPVKVQIVVGLLCTVRHLFAEMYMNLFQFAKIFLRNIDRKSVV